jgi:bifunctional DNase/RNase
MDVQQMVIYGVSFDVIGKQPIVLLKTVDGNRFLPIWIGHPEAAAIRIKLQGTQLPRPMTHDLLANLIGTFDAEIARITVTELKDSTFYATLTLVKDGSEIEVDSRPSDALALAVRTQAPIFASQDLVEENAIEFEREVDDTEQIVESFRDFLESVNPEDFAHAEAGVDEEFADEEEEESDEEDDDYPTHEE